MTWANLDDEDGFLQAYALLFPGYEWSFKQHGDRDNVAHWLQELAERQLDDLPSASLEELRAMLFLWQRARRFTDCGEPIEENDVAHARRLLTEIRRRHALGETSPNSREKGYGRSQRITRHGRRYDVLPFGWLSDTQTGHLIERKNL